VVPLAPLEQAARLEQEEPLDKWYYWHIRHLWNKRNLWHLWNKWHFWNKRNLWHLWNKRNFWRDKFWW
jgi:hypothetical protein